MPRRTAYPPLYETRKVEQASHARYYTDATFPEVLEFWIADERWMMLNNPVTAVTGNPWFHAEENTFSVLRINETSAPFKSSNFNHIDIKYSHMLKHTVIQTSTVHNPSVAATEAARRSHERICMYAEFKPWRRLSPCFATVTDEEPHSARVLRSYHNQKYTAGGHMKFDGWTSFIHPAWMNSAWGWFPEDAVDTNMIGVPYLAPVWASTGNNYDSDLRWGLFFTGLHYPYASAQWDDQQALQTLENRMRFLTVNENAREAAIVEHTLREGMTSITNQLHAFKETHGHDRWF